MAKMISFFLGLLREAVKRSAFHRQTLEQLRALLLGNPLLDVIGIAEDGRLSNAIDSELYGENFR
jgi:hypothetical protein